jgi:benzil reductase ((S)-benzoin forming)
MSNINTILITGASRGLGHALATRFAHTGHMVFAVGRDPAALEQLQANHPKLIHTIVADITTEMGRDAIRKQVTNTGKPLSIIHNAAIAQTSAFPSVTEKSFQEHFVTNVFAPMLLTQQCLPLLTAGQRILHISSGAAVFPLANQLIYCASKAAVEHASRCLNVELNNREIYSGILWPGLMDSPMQEKLRTVGDPATREFYIKAKTQQQLLEPALVAEFVEWVLLKTNHTDFSAKTWDIYDVEQHPHWLPQSIAAPSYNVI